MLLLLLLLLLTTTAAATATVTINYPILLHSRKIRHAAVWYASSCNQPNSVSLVPQFLASKHSETFASASQYVISILIKSLNRGLAIN